MTLAHEPLLTRELSREDFRPPAGSSYVYGLAAEERAVFGDTWKERAAQDGVHFVSVAAQSADDIVVSASSLGMEDEIVSVRDAQALREFIESLPQPIYLDVTGLIHNAWAPLLRSCVQSAVQVFVVYVEPAEYRRSTAPAQGLIFDLSTRIGGIAPIAGFVSLRRPRRPEDSCFVPFLGFEGARLGYIMSTVEPVPSKTVPVIGVPGFRPEYPFYSYSGNRVQLETDYLHSSVRYAKANCPFDAFHVLTRISADFPQDFMRVAPIGTKPHGVGAILFALSRPRSVEIIYDHPERKEQRTSGEARVCLYDVSSFIASELFLGTLRGTS